MTAVLSSGNQDLAVESQRVFRSLLQAMAEPGTVATLGSAFQHPAQLGQAKTAVALTLLDTETAVWLSPRLRVQIGRASCRERVCQCVSISLVAGSIKKK